MSETLDQPVTDTQHQDVGNQTADTQPIDTKPAGETQNQDTKPEPVVPEKYEFALPDGVVLDQDAADEFTAVAKDLKLSQDDAKRLTNVAIQMQKRQMENHGKQVEAWIGELKADKELGGEKLTENLGVARKALETFGSQELYQILATTGFESHPAVVRAFYKIGRAISEDRFVKGSPPSGNEPDMAKRMFPNMN